MGCENVPLGYHESLFEDLGGTKSGDGAYLAYSTYVQTGEVWVLESISIRNTDGTRGVTQLTINDGADNVPLAMVSSQEANIPLIWTGQIVISEGQRLRVRMQSCLDGDEIEAWVVGYKVTIPG